MRILLADYLGNRFVSYHSKDNNIDYNYLQNLLRISDRFKVDRVLLLGEGGTGSTYRKNLLPSYKSTRKKRRESQSDADKAAYKKFIEQGTAFVKDVVPHTGMEFISVLGTEADDLCGYITSVMDTSKHQLLLLTEDTDWAQCIKPNVVIGSYRAMTKYEHKLSKADWLNVENYTSSKGFTPRQMYEIKLMTGDTSDDIPGVDGVGETGAKRIMEKYGSLEEIIRNRNEIDVPRLSTKAKENFKTCLETFALGNKLMSLCWEESQWEEILGKTGAYRMRRLVDTIESKPEVNTKAFNELCYERGWINLVDREIDLPWN